MPSPADLFAHRERKNAEEHDAVFGAAKADVERLFDHFAQKINRYDETAALLTLAVILALPEGEPYE